MFGLIDWSAICNFSFPNLNCHFLMGIWFETKFSFICFLSLVSIFRPDLLHIPFQHEIKGASCYVSGHEFVVVRQNPSQCLARQIVAKSLFRLFQFSEKYFVSKSLPNNYRISGSIRVQPSFGPFLRFKKWKYFMILPKENKRRNN